MIGKTVAGFTKYAVLLLGTLLIIYPILLFVLTSFKTPGEVTGNPNGLPSALHWSNYWIGFQKGDLAKASLNSLIYTTLSVTSLTVVSAMAAYVVSRFDFKAGPWIKFYLLGGLMIPFQVVLIPLFKIVQLLHLNSNVFGVVLIYIALGIPFAFFLYTGYLKSIPKELEESAYIDGCNYYLVFWKIVLPLIVPATATIVIFNVITIWNDFFIPLVFLADPDRKPLQLAIYSFVGQYSSEWNVIFACMVMASIPVVALFLFLQRYFVSGMMSGAVKG